MFVPVPVSVSVALTSACDASSLNAHSVTWVVCLCAQWCGLCRDYRAVFASMAERYPAWRFVWLDVEDQADVVGDVDVETFPTLLLADARGMRFFGPLTPQANTLARLLESLQSDSLQIAPHELPTQQLLQTLQAMPKDGLKASS